METTGKVMMIQKKNRLKKIVLCAFVSAVSVLTLCLILIPQRVAAATGANEKAALYRLATCYNRGVMKSPITIVSTASAGVTGATQFKGIGSLIQGTGTNAYQDVVFNSINNNGNATKSCREIITAAVDGSGKSTGGNETAKAAFLKGMGYQASTTKSQCATFTYNSTIGNRAQTARVCAEVENGKVKSGTVKVTNDANGDVLKLSNTAQMDGVELINDRCMNTSTWQLKDSCRVTVGSDMSFRSLVDAINAKIISENGQSVNVVGGTSYTFAGSKIDSSGTAMQIFTMSNTSTAARDAIKFLSGGEYSQASDIKLSIEEQKTILKDILTNFYGMSGNNLVCNVSDSVGSGMSGFVKISIDGKTCWGKPTRTDRVMAFSSDGTPDGTLKSFEQIVQMMNALDGKTDSHQSDIAECKERLEKKRDEYLKAANDGSANYSEELRQKYKDSAAEIDEKLQSNKYYSEQNGAIVCASYTDPTGNVVTPGEENNSSSSSSSDSENDLKECFDNASMLGWIFCPILKFVGSTLEDLYEKVEENFLVTDASKYTEGAEINQGWSKIRNFANIAFAIALLIVILSQVTGFGISNYGIKKILPTLIMIVVLVNISFFLCQIAIDVSNILGVALKEFFEGLSQESLDSFQNTGRSFVGGLLSAVGIVGISGVGITVGIANAPFIAGAVLANLPAVIITLVVMLISLFFFFLLLGVRQAGILIAVILSPLAVICYALPNTKSLFQKWKKLFTSLLMVYPICGLMMGATGFVSNLMLESQNSGFFFNLVAALLQVVPFFMIPSIVRSSMNVLGNLGTRIPQIGQRLSGFAGRQIRNSERLQDFQKHAEGDFAKTRYDRLMHKANGDLSNLSVGERRRLARYGARYRKQRIEETDARLNGANASEEIITNEIADMERKSTDKNVNSFISSVLNGRVDGIDGNDINSVRTAYADALAQSRARPNDERLRNRAYGLQQMLQQRFGDKGKEALYDVLDNQIHNNEGSNISDSTRSMLARLSDDGKWMSDVKATDPHLFNMINDGSKRGGTVKTTQDYMKDTINSMTPERLSKAGDSWRAQAQNMLTNNQFDAAEVDKLANAYSSAISNPELAKHMKTDDINLGNLFRAQQYDNDLAKFTDQAVNQYMQSNNITSPSGVPNSVINKAFNDFRAQNGTFQALSRAERKALAPPKGYDVDGKWIGNGPETKDDKMARRIYMEEKTRLDIHHGRR